MKSVGKFVLEKPIGERRAICIRLIAQFAAGYLAERNVLGDNYEARVEAPDGDRSDIQNKAVLDVAATEDQDVIEGTVAFDDWSKKPDVEALIAKGEELSTQFLNELASAVKEIADIARRVRGIPGRNLHTIVESAMKERGIEKFVPL